MVAPSTLKDIHGQYSPIISATLPKEKAITTASFSMDEVIWHYVFDDLFLDRHAVMRLANVDRKRWCWLRGSYTWRVWRNVVADLVAERQAREAARLRAFAAPLVHRTWQDDPYLSDSS